jgi:hypothetical protein
MNTKYKNTPEIIASLRKITPAGDDIGLGDRVAGIQVVKTTNNPTGTVQIDVRDLQRNQNLIVEFELPELVAALSLATLNAEEF